jgi:hypothetical protein
MRTDGRWSLVDEFEAGRQIRQGPSITNKEFHMYPVEFSKGEDGIEERICGDPGAQSYRLVKLVVCDTKRGTTPLASGVMLLEMQVGTPELIPHLKNFTISGVQNGVVFGSLVRVAHDYVERVSADNWARGYLFKRNPAGAPSKLVREFFMLHSVETLSAEEYQKAQAAAEAARAADMGISDTDNAWAS